MKEEFVYCHLWWVDGLVWRLLCQESDFGPIRGLTVEEYETLKPKVEKLTVDSFAQTKKIWPNMTGPSKEEIEKQIDYVKTKFKDFEKHPEKLGKTTDDITFTVLGKDVGLPSWFWLSEQWYQWLSVCRAVGNRYFRPNSRQGDRSAGSSAERVGKGYEKMGEPGNGKS